MHGPADVFFIIDAEGHEQVSGLVVMVRGTVEQGDVPVVAGQLVP